MTLVDTSVWMEHLRRGNARLGELLERGLVLIHPFIIGELACGVLKERQRVLSDLETLPSVGVALHACSANIETTLGRSGRGG